MEPEETEIQSANETSRNTALSILSNPAIEHLAHYLFLFLLKYFFGDARKNAFIRASEKLRSNYKSFLWITWEVYKVWITVWPKREIGITPPLLDKNGAQQHANFYLCRRWSRQKETGVEPDNDNGSRIHKPKDIRASHLLTKTTRQKEKWWETQQGGTRGKNGSSNQTNQPRSQV